MVPVLIGGHKGTDWWLQVWLCVRERGAGQRYLLGSQFNKVSMPPTGAFTMQNYFTDDQRDACFSSGYDSKQLKAM